MGKRITGQSGKNKQFLAAAKKKIKAAEKLGIKPAPLGGTARPAMQGPSKKFKASDNPDFVNHAKRQRAKRKRKDYQTNKQIPFQGPLSQGGYGDYEY